jgi:antitoxin VapB
MKVWVDMHVTKVFKSGNSMAVRLPKEFQIASGTVEILKRDGEIIIREIPQNLVSAFELLASLPTDFFVNGRQDLPPQDREY